MSLTATVPPWPRPLNRWRPNWMGSRPWPCFTMLGMDFNWTGTTTWCQWMPSSIHPRMCRTRRLTSSRSSRPLNPPIPGWTSLFWMLVGITHLQTKPVARAWHSWTPLQGLTWPLRPVLAMCAGCVLGKFKVPDPNLIWWVSLAKDAKKIKLEVTVSAASVTCSPTYASANPSWSAKRWLVYLLEESLWHCAQAGAGASWRCCISFFFSHRDIWILVQCVRLIMTVKTGFEHGETTRFFDIELTFWFTQWTGKLSWVGLL